MAGVSLVRRGKLRFIVIPEDSSWELISEDSPILRASALVMGSGISYLDSSVSRGRDIDDYLVVNINGSVNGLGVTFSIKIYENEPVASPSITLNGDAVGKVMDEASVNTASLRAQVFLGRVFSYTPYNWIRPVFLSHLEGEVTLASFAMFINPANKATVILSSLEPRAPQLLKLTPGSSFINATLGLSGTVSNIPKGTRISSLVVYGDRPSEALERWGRFIRGIYGRSRTAVEAYRDFIDSLQYWTDTGGMYWYRTLPGMNYLETMREIKRYMDKSGIGVKYYQVDSWWYPKDAEDGGAIEYREVPELGGDLSKLSSELGPLISIHIRYLSKSSPYAKKYASVVTGNATCITDPESYFEDLMSMLRSKGVLSVKHDWLTTIRQRCRDVYMTNTDMLTRYLDALFNAARRHGILIELCMPDAYHYFIGSRHDNALMIRTSADYGDALPKHYLLYQNAYSSMLALQLGYSPFFDVFITKNYHAYADLLARVIFYSVVGIGDAIDKDPYWRRGVNVDLLRRFLSPQWVVLRPDSPARLIDEMYLHDPYTEAIPLIAQTSARGIGIIALFNVNRDLDQVCYQLRSDELNLGPLDSTALIDLTSGSYGLGSLSVCVRRGEPHVVAVVKAAEPAVLGLTRYAIPPVSITSIKAEYSGTRYRAELSLVEAGELMVYSPRRPVSVRVDESEVSYSYNEGNRLLMIPISKTSLVLNLNY